MTGVISCGAAAPGTRRITAHSFAAQRAADRFDGLPADLNPLKLLDDLRRGRVVLGLDERLLNHLEYLIRMTLPCDWEEGQNPRVWQSVAVTALDRGVTSRTVQNIERRLNELGWITWNDSGNHRRSGYRCLETGYIEEAWGVDLSPLGARAGEVRAAAERAAVERAEWRREKKKWGSESRAVKRLLAALGRIDSAAPLVRTRVSEITPLPLLCKMVRDITALRLELEAECAALPGFEGAGGGDDPGAGETPPGAAPDSPDPAPLHGPDPVAAAEGANPQEPCGRTPGTSGMGDAAFRQHLQNTKPKPESFGYMYGREGESEPERRWIDCGIEHIDPPSLQQLASQAVSERLPWDRPAGWRDVMLAGRGLRCHLGIGNRLWADGCRLIGPAAMSVLLMIAATRHECRGSSGNMVLNPGGWVHGCLKKAAAGELRLAGSVYGLLGGGGEAGR